MNNRWKQITRLFTKALKLNEADREVWLEEACGGDRELYEEVDSLVRAYTSPGLPGQSLEDLRVMAFLQLDEKEMKSKQIGPFQLQELIGAGGMGVVYRARDTRLERDVAIKFPPPAWSLNEHAKQRFLQEARSAASLDHPNVCTIYETGEMDNGSLYMAMAYYQGQTLQQRLEKGPLPVDEALDIALQTARGLDSAHRQGLVHRDIKPANLMITPGGTLKILDFGIAKAADAGLTMTGQQPGTAAYMAPEQTRGGEVDGRADLWSLGVVLCEMLTGTRPSKEPKPPSALRPEIPSAIDNLLLGLLDPDPAGRPEQARDVAIFLEKLIETGHGSPGSLTGSRRRRAMVYPVLSILVVVAGLGSYFYFQHGSVPALPPDQPYTLAVLPFTNIGGDPDEEFFSDGLTEELLTTLARMPDLRVISRSSVMRYKGSDQPLREIADELGASHVLEGSLRRANGDLRITAQLIDASSDHHLWADSYDRNLEDIFAIQRNIATHISEALGSSFAVTEDPAATRRTAPTEDLEAYELYLQGRYHFHNYIRLADQGPLPRSVDYYRRAIERDPDFALAWAGKAASLALLNTTMYNAQVDFDETVAAAQAAANRALELDPTVAEAHVALAMLNISLLQWLETEDNLLQAIELEPSSQIARLWYGIFLVSVGKSEQAREILMKAMALDPLSAITAHWLADAQRNSGHLEASRIQAQRGVDLGMATSGIGVYIYHVLRVQLDEAVDYLIDNMGLQGVDPRWVRPLVDAIENPEQVPGAVRIAETVAGENPFFVPVWYYFDLQAPDPIFDGIETFFEEGRPSSALWRMWEPQFTHLRNHPRFLEIAERSSILDYWRVRGWPDLCQPVDDGFECD